MSKTIEFFMNRPNLVAQLPPEMKQSLLAAVREELGRIRGQGNSNPMPASAFTALVEAVPDDLVRQLVADGRRGVEPGWLPPKAPDLTRVTDPERVGEPAEPRGTGWVTAPGLEGSVPYVRHVDAVAEHFNQIDKAEQRAKFTRRI
jgi:hypothetical protein